MRNAMWLNSPKKFVTMPKIRIRPTAKSPGPVSKSLAQIQNADANSGSQIKSHRVCSPAVIAGVITTTVSNPAISIHPLTIPIPSNRSLMDFEC